MIKDVKRVSNPPKLQISCSPHTISTLFTEGEKCHWKLLHHHKLLLLLFFRVPPPKCLSQFRLASKNIIIILCPYPHIVWDFDPTPQKFHWFWLHFFLWKLTLFENTEDFVCLFYLFIFCCTFPTTLSPSWCVLRHHHPSEFQFIFSSIRFGGFFTVPARGIEK